MPSIPNNFNFNNILHSLTKVFEFYTNHELIANLTFTCIVIISAFSIRKLWISKLSPEITLEERRRKYVNIRNGLGLLATVFIALIWATELKTLTVSLIAIAAAVVLATKEVIMSLMGGFLRGTTAMYKIGDRIEVKGLRGDVIDVSLLSTTLMEVGPSKHQLLFTGKLLHIPHSLLLTEILSIDHVTSNYTTHTFEVPVYPELINPALAKSAMLSECIKACSTFKDQAFEHYQQVQQHTAIDMPSTEPKVLLRADASGCWWLTIRLVLPTKLRNTIEQTIIDAYLSVMEAYKTVTPP